MLIAFEGVHSAGKSTQVRLLVDALRQHGLRVVTTASNGSPIGHVVTRLKIAGEIDPLSMALAEAADLAHRHASVVRDALAAGDVVVADRWTYTHVARARVRGVSLELLRSCLAFAPAPDLVVFVRCDARVALARRLAIGERVDGHMSGSDYRHVSDHEAGFVAEQTRLNELYAATLAPDALVLDGAAPPSALHAQVMDRVAQLLTPGDAPGR